MRHFLTLNDFGKDEILEIINLAREIKKEAKARDFKPYLKDQKLAMIFEKSSTRTRVSFDVGMNDTSADFKLMIKFNSAYPFSKNNSDKIK